MKAWRAQLVVLFCGALCGLTIACSSPAGGAGPKPVVPVQPTPTGAQPVAGDPARPPAQPGKPLLDPAGQSCTSAPCAYHAGTASYFHCLAGGAGACFHFGSPCQPADACMFDATARSYKRCAEIVEGKCQRYGAACEPSGSCWYRPEDRLYRECLERRPGSCARWGEPCTPADPSA